MRALLELPKIIRVTLRGRRRNEDDFRAVKSKRPRPFRKVTVITDVDSDSRVSGLESGEAEIARREVELLPEARQAMRNVSLPVLAQILSIGVNHRRGVVVDAGHLLFVEWNNYYHLMLTSNFTHQLSRRPLGNSLDQVVPVRVLFGREVRPVEQFLQADDLHSALRGEVNHSDVLIDHGRLDSFNAAFGGFFIGSLYQAASDDLWHYWLPLSVHSQLRQVLARGVGVLFLRSYLDSL